VIIAAGLVFARIISGFSLLEPAVYVLAGLTIITTAQRIAHVWGQLRSA
jgi:hypothetical protein